MTVNAVAGNIHGQTWHSRHTGHSRYDGNGKADSLKS